MATALHLEPGALLGEQLLACGACDDSWAHLVITRSAPPFEPWAAVVNCGACGALVDTGVTNGLMDAVWSATTEAQLDFAAEWRDLILTGTRRPTLEEKVTEAAEYAAAEVKAEVGKRVRKVKTAPRRWRKKAVRKLKTSARRGLRKATRAAGRRARKMAAPAAAALLRTAWKLRTGQPFDPDQADVAEDQEQGDGGEQPVKIPPVAAYRKALGIPAPRRSRKCLVCGSSSGGGTIPHPELTIPCPSC